MTTFCILAELACKTQQLSTEIEAHKVTKENLEKAKRDIKKKNVLSLEMEDYERSMKELSNKMEESKKKMMQVKKWAYYYYKVCFDNRTVGFIRICEGTTD